MTEENEEDCDNKNVCRFYHKGIFSDKVGDDCYLTGKYRYPVHNTCNINVTQKQCNFVPFMFHNFSNNDSHMFFKRLVDLKNEKVKFDIIPKTNEEFISPTYGYTRFIDSYSFLSISLDRLVKKLNEDDFKIRKKVSPDKWQCINKKLAYPYGTFISIADFKKPVDNLKKEDFFSTVKNKNHDDKEIHRTKEIIRIFDIKNGEDMFEFYLKKDVILLADVF